jgi:aminoglycoside phosphotransferase
VIKRRPALDRRRALAAVAVPRILAALPENGAGAPASTWTAHALLGSVTERLVVLAGPPGAPPCAVLKLAESEKAARGLVRETEVLSLLSGDLRLCAWRAVLPEVLAAGEIDGEPFRVEGVLPGVEGSRLIARGAAPVARLARLAEGIEGLHRPTGTELDVCPTVVDSWVDAPLAILGHHARRQPGVERCQRRALDRLRDELHEALVGRRLTVGWTHGDYAPANILVDPAGTVSGIVDWELAACQSPQAIDLVHLVLAARALRRQREYSAVVLDALAGRLTEEERALLARAVEPLGCARPLSALVLLAWLRHTQNLLTKADGYAESWLWHRLNFDVPLAALA